MQGPKAAIELFHGYTYSGHPAAAAALIATLAIYESEELLTRAATIERYWQDAVHSLRAAPGVADIRDIGWSRIELEPHDGEPGAREFKTFRAAYEAGLWFESRDTIALSPPLIISEAQIDELVDKLRGAIAAAGDNDASIVGICRRAAHGCSAAPGTARARPGGALRRRNRAAQRDHRCRPGRSRACDADPRERSVGARCRADPDRVTAVLPRGRQSTRPVFAGWFTLNAAGEMTGTTWLEERGLLDGPVMITNTHSVGVVRRCGSAMDGRPRVGIGLARAGDDRNLGWALNDLNGFHVRQEHALAALNGARGGPVAEGSVGGGTGMMCNDFKGGIGTASRRLPADRGGYTVGVLVQCNYGHFARSALRIAGAPVGQEMANVDLPCFVRPVAKPAVPIRAMRNAGDERGRGDMRERDGSIIVVVATDAPLLPHQLKRLAKRPALGLGRLGSIAANGSGDIFIAFSTANPEFAKRLSGELRSRSRCSPTIAFRHCSRRSPRRPRKRWSMRWSRPKRWRAPTACASTDYRISGCEKSLPSTTG